MTKGWMPIPPSDDGREPTTADHVAAVVAAWNDGLLANAEVAAKIADLLTAVNVDDVWAATPDEWRGDLMEQFQALASDGELLSIHDAHVEQVIRPAVRAWLRRRGPSP